MTKHQFGCRRKKRCALTPRGYSANTKHLRTLPNRTFSLRKSLAATLGLARRSGIPPSALCTCCGLCKKKKKRAPLVKSTEARGAFTGTAAIYISRGGGSHEGAPANQNVCAQLARATHRFGTNAKNNCDTRPSCRCVRLLFRARGVRNPSGVVLIQSQGAILWFALKSMVQIDRTHDSNRGEGGGCVHWAYSNKPFSLFK